MSQTATPANTLLDDVLKFVEVSSYGLKMAMDEIDVHRTQQTKAAGLQPPLLDKLVGLGLVGATQKTAGAAMLASHAETLNLFNALVEKYAALRTEKAAKDHLGGGVDPKQAGLGPVTPDGDSTTSPFVGGFRAGEKKASDLAILAVLDAPPGR